MKNFSRTLIYALIIFVLISGTYTLIQGQFKEKKEFSLSYLVEQINSGLVDKITVEEDLLTIKLKDGSEARSQKEREAGLSETLKNYGVDQEKLKNVTLEVKSAGGAGYWLGVIIPFLAPLLLIGFFIWWTARQVQRGSVQAFSFGQSRARLVNPENSRERITFKDVAGAKEAKEELREIVDFLKNPRKFFEIGARIPHGVLLMGAPGTGKCVTGDTLLLTNKGVLPIDEVPKYFTVRDDSTVDGLDVVSLDPKTLELKKVAASHWYQLGKQGTVRVKTDMGISIEGTPEHPVVVVDRHSGNFLFKRLDELTKDDWVVMAHNTDTFGGYTKIPSEDISYFLGVLTGDGCLTVRNRVVLSTADPEILSRMQEITRRTFGLEFKKNHSRPYDYEFSDLSVKQQLRQWGLTETYAEGKRMPEWIRIAPRLFVVEFLRGLFDTDGYVEKNGSVGFSSASRALIEDVSFLLLNLGIVGRQYSRKKLYNGKRQYYLAIYGDFVERFRSEIDFRIRRKADRLAAVCNLQRNTNINRVPHQGAAIQAVWRETAAATARHLDRAFYAQSWYKNAKRYINGERLPSPHGLATFVNGVSALAPDVVRMPEVAYLQKLSQGRFFFTPVKEISQGEAVVYDLTVPHLHNFVANGFINHNTMLARAVSGEANVPFFHISGSEFVEMFVGVGASRVRDLFKVAKKSAPAIIFIDEIDAVGRHRGTGIGGGHDEREQTLNQILVEMDGFETNESVIVIAATNRPDVLDPALLRPGRFDRRVVLDLPDINDREEILKIHAANKVMDKDVNIRTVAERTPGFSGADLSNLVNEAAIFAARVGRKSIAQSDLISAIEKVMLGPERKSHILTPKEKEIVAYHEAGHALVAASLKHTDPVHKISIVARGRAGGVTWKLPSEDRHLFSRSYFIDEIAVALGGFAAEKMVFNEITTGPHNDLERASDLARDIVTRYGMSDKVGPTVFGERQEMVFLGKDIGAEKIYSEEMARLIDSEVRRIIDNGLKKAREVIARHRAKLNIIAKRLMEKETIEREEFDALMAAA